MGYDTSNVLYSDRNAVGMGIGAISAARQPAGRIWILSDEIGGKEYRYHPSGSFAMRSSFAKQRRVYTRRLAILLLG